MGGARQLTPRRLPLAAGLLLGAALRLAALPLHGSSDVLIWKVWSFAAARDVTAVYGIGGSPPERRVLKWRDVEMTVDYPPASLYQLGLVGRAYGAARPGFDDSAWLNAAVKLPGLVAECALVAFLFAFGRRHWGEAGAGAAVLAVWLNPAVVLNGAVLGYLDLQMAAPLLIALLLAWSGKPAWAGILTALAVLTKPQAAVVLPLVGAAIAWHLPRRFSAAAAWAAAGAVTSAALLVPFILRGAWSNLAQAVGRVATHDMLSGQACNVWWIATWALRVRHGWADMGAWDAITQEVRILGISRALALGYPNARTIGLAIVAAALLWAVLRARRTTRVEEICALAAWSLYAYAMFATQVHENHLALAVVLLAPAAALDPGYRGVFGLLSAVVTLNMYLFYGFGVEWPSVVPKSVTVLDATLLLSVVSLGCFAWLTRVVARRTAAGGP